jgi:hypothetical protein
MSLVFQNIDLPPPSPPGECVPPAFGVGGRTHSLGGERGGETIFWKTWDTALYSTNVSTLWLQQYYTCSLTEWPYIRVFSIPSTFFTMGQGSRVKASEFRNIALFVVGRNKNPKRVGADYWNHWKTQFLVHERRPCEASLKMSSMGFLDLPVQY